MMDERDKAALQMAIFLMVVFTFSIGVVVGVNLNGQL